LFATCKFAQQTSLHFTIIIFHFTAIFLFLRWTTFG